MVVACTVVTTLVSSHIMMCGQPANLDQSISVSDVAATRSKLLTDYCNRPWGDSFAVPRP